MTSSTSSTYVYVSCAGSNEIRILRMDRESGRLDPVAEITLAHPSGNPPPARKPPNGFTMPLAVSPDRKFMYSAMRYPPYTFVGMAIDAATGTLKLIGQAPLPASLAYIATDNTGTWFMGASVPQHLFALGKVSGGMLQGAPRTIEPGPRPHYIHTDAANRFVYATVRDADLVGWWSFDAATGAIPDKPLGTVDLGKDSHPRHIAFHPNNRLLYVITEMSAHVHAFDIDPLNGSLKEFQRIAIQPPDFEPESHCADIHLSPDGRFLYASERFASPISCYRVDQRGRLELVERFIADAGPRSFAIEPRGRFLISAGQDSEDLSVHAIDGTTGRLKTLAKYSMSINPSWVEIIDLP